MIQLTAEQLKTLLGGDSAHGSLSLASLAVNPTLLGVLITATLGLFGVWIANVITGNLKDQELFLKSLEFLEGGTQKRSIGIAVLKIYADSGVKKGRREAAAIIFRAQMFHLETGRHHVRPYDNRIEAFNFHIMNEILTDWGDSLPRAVKDAAAEVRGAWISNEDLKG